jgi:hypothetical protein
MVRINLSLNLDATSSTFVLFPSPGFFKVFGLVGSTLRWSLEGALEPALSEVSKGPLSSCLIFNAPHFKVLYSYTSHVIVVIRTLLTEAYLELCFLGRLSARAYVPYTCRCELVFRNPNGEQ